MNKIALLLSFMLLSNLCYASDSSSFDIKAGIIAIKGDGKPFVFEETTRIPYRKGLIFGVIVSSYPQIEFECMASFRDPSDVVTINNDDLNDRLKSTEKIDATTTKTGTITTVSTKQAMCKGNFYGLIKLNDTDKPGERTISVTINKTQYPAVIFDVFSAE